MDHPNIFVSHYVEYYIGLKRVKNPMKSSNLLEGLWDG